MFHELQPLFTDDVSELEPFVPIDTTCSGVTETLVANEQISDGEVLRNASSSEENRADYCTGRDQLQETVKTYDNKEIRKQELCQQMVTQIMK